MKKSVLVLGLLLSSTTAFARGGDFGVGNGGDGLEMAFGGSTQGPSSPESLSVTYEGLQKTWDKAKMISEAMLVGSWKEIARASDPQPSRCREEALYDSKGLKNSDDSLPTLQIRYMKKSELELTGEEVNSILAITFFNIGESNINQGPYKVRSEESQFARYRYDGHGNIDKDGIDGSSSYVDYYCKLLPVGGKMICKYVTINSFPREGQATLYDKVCTSFGVFTKESSKK